MAFTITQRESAAITFYDSETEVKLMAKKWVSGSYT